MLATLKLNVKFSISFFAGIEHHNYISRPDIHILGPCDLPRPFSWEEERGTGKEDGLTFEKGLIGLFSGW